MDSEHRHEIDPPARPANKHLNDLYEDVRQAVVLVKTEHGCGSGFFVDSAGNLLTAHHVIDRAKNVECTLQNGSTLSAHVRAIDVANDLALLKLNANIPGIRPLRLGESLSLTPYEKIFSVTHQLGNSKAKLDTGSYTHHGTMPGGTYRLWSTSLTKPGSSGGPIMGASGKIIGVTSAGDSSFTASIPSEQVIDFLSAHDPKFIARRAPAGWLVDHLDNAKERPALGLLTLATGLGGGYAYYRLARHLPKAAGVAGAISVTSVLFADHTNWTHSRNGMEVHKYGLAMAADAGVVMGLGLSVFRKKLGISTSVLSLASRIGAEFYPIRTVLE